MNDQELGKFIPINEGIRNLKLPMTTNGAFIMYSIIMSSNLKGHFDSDLDNQLFFQFLFLTTIVSYILAIIIILWLWFSLTTFSVGFCSEPKSLGAFVELQCIIVLVFFFTLIKAVWDIREEISVVFATDLKFHILGKDEDLTIDFPFDKKICLGLCLILEIAVLVGIITVGTRYILNFGSVSDIVQAAVAITYVNDIDAMLYQALSPFYPESLKKCMRGTGTLKKPSHFKINSTKWRYAFYFSVVFFTAVILTVLAAKYFICGELNSA